MSVEDNSSRPLDFFILLLQAFHNAATTKLSVINHDYIIGRQTVRLSFAGSALVPLITPAIEHLRTEPVDQPDLTVYLWDSDSTGEAVPPVPWSRQDYIARGEVKGFNTCKIRTTFNLGSGILNMLDLDSGKAIFWIRSFKRVPYYETGSPLRSILYWWMSSRGYQYAHAAAVGTDQGGVLLVGKGGSGKSTAALACLEHETLLYAGDDYVLIGNDPAPYVYSLYNSAKLDAGHAKNFPHLLKYAANRDKLENQKALIFLDQLYAGKMCNGFPLRAIVVPRVSGLPSSTVVHVSAGETLRALAPSTIFQIPGSGRETFRYLSRFVKLLPGYRLKSGTDFSGIPATISTLLDTVANDA